jgi:type I restriction enzyme, S subunit
VPEHLAGCYCSGEFPLFQPYPEKLDARWFHWITKARWFWQRCDVQSQGTSGKNRIQPEKFLDIAIPLPPLFEQQRIVARIERLAAKIEEVRTLKQRVEDRCAEMLQAMFSGMVRGAPTRVMGEVAPLVRRPVEVREGELYPELGIRSFGKGTFHKPPLDFLEVGTKRIFRIEPGDLLFSNVFAWEGAIAVAQPEDSGRFGSHRFISCIPKPGFATSDFLCFYFLAPEGQEKIRVASPGGAGRNRTLGLEKLAHIEVPLPDYGTQLQFNQLQVKTRKILDLQTRTAADLDALLPAVLDRAFRGEL